MRSSEWTLRPATAADREFLYELHRAAMRPYVEAVWGWDEGVQRDFFERRLEHEDSQVIEVDGERVGVLALEDRGEERILALVELLPARQGRGIGTAVLRSVLAEGRPVTLRVLTSNPRGRALYEREGFRVVRVEEPHVYLRHDGQ